MWACGHFAEAHWFRGQNSKSLQTRHLAGYVTGEVKQRRVVRRLANRTPTCVWRQCGEEVGAPTAEVDECSSKFLTSCIDSDETVGAN
jgi:hypothetical protein